MSLLRAGMFVTGVAGMVVAAKVLSRARVVSEDEKRDYERRVLGDVNETRVRHGLSPLTEDEELDTLGRYYAGLMRSTRTFAHQIDKNSVGARMHRFGVGFERAAENLQRNDLKTPSRAAAETVWGDGGWMNSKAGHREAMLDPDYQKAGVGVESDGRTWHVAMYFKGE